MGNAVKELGEVEQKDVSLLPVLAVMLVEMLPQAPDGERIALARHAGPVVMNKSAVEHRHERVVA